MDMNPQRVRTAEFRTVKRGLDPDEVQAFLHSVADELERAQNQSTAMEARARAAVARLQELSEDASTQSAATAAATVVSSEDSAPVAAASEAEVFHASVDQSETISRTLLLAQRTADTTVAEARAEAERLRAEAESEANQQIDSSREMSEALLNEARAEARKVGEAERTAMEGEVNSLAARRDFLESDVDHLEQFLVDQRARLRDAAAQIVELTERVPSGLGEVRRPLVSGTVGTAAETQTEMPSDAPDDDQEELWLPNAVDDGPPAGNPSDDG